MDEIVSEVGSWPGVRIVRRSAELVQMLYDDVELGVLDRDRGMAELRFSASERDELVEHGDAGPSEPLVDSENVSHDVRGPADVTAVLELFNRRYRDVRGEDAPYSSREPD